VAAATGAAIAVAGLVAFGAIGGRNRSPVPPPAVTAPGDPVDYNVALRVALSVSPSIMTVRATTGDTTTVGSGVVTSRTRVVTSAHGVAGATAVTVTTPDGRNLAAKVIGVDPQTDLALLDLGNADLSPATLSTGSDVRIGQPVVGVGRGTTLAFPWFSIGVVSDHNVLVSANGVSVAGLVESDVKVRADTAGGALLDQNGFVVGIVTQPPGSPTSGLAVPIAVALDVAHQLDTTGKVFHGWLGVLYAPDTPAPSAAGARIGSVVPDGPAAKALLTAGDTIVVVDGDQVNDIADLMAEARKRHPNDPLAITFLRDGKSHTTTLTLGVQNAGAVAAWPTSG
jgi:S1-C subfamily serine protease